ncbi:dienelactone hydrolase family protein [Halorientalis pallida]|uniref:Dienelactone hydrolase family protein n=1 Tax=Halorientalis pallida TaxID=2479928 RepID=A0A498KT07_9EURY|nr:dienelactone hydrolase family protein [Halorientalis pallida]RXK47009.1 dienelactone hydrolase family protein [Halorientalis pallida]
MRIKALAVFTVAMLLLSGCSGVSPTESTAEEMDPTTQDPQPEQETNTAEASYTQTPHTGCQPGTIKKDGTCQPVTSNSNADIFDVKNLNPITTENTTIDGTQGYLARPDAEGDHPAVVMVHEWWGLNQNIRHMADILAGQGYVVFAVDLYEGRVASNSSYAAELSGEVRENPDEAVQKMRQATAGVRNLSSTTNRVASLGWCFGGGQSLQLSLSEAELNATVIYYGTLATDRDTLRQIDEPVLGIFGSEDQVVGIESVREFNQTLGELGVEREIYVYEDARHAFANPSGESFRPEATRNAWSKTLRFLNRTLRADVNSNG